MSAPVVDVEALVEAAADQADNLALNTSLAATVQSDQGAQERSAGDRGSAARDAHAHAHRGRGTAFHGPRESNNGGSSEHDARARHRRRRDDSGRPSSDVDTDSDEARRGFGTRAGGRRFGPSGRLSGDHYSGGGARRLRSRSPRGERFRSRSPHGGRHYRPAYRDEGRRDEGRRDRERDRDRDRDRRDRGRDRGRGPRRGSPDADLAKAENDKRVVFVQQLAARLTKDELVRWFGKVGPVADATIVTDRCSGRSKGMGYVQFRNAEDVPKALELTGQKLKGLPVIVQNAEAEKNRQARLAEGGGNRGIPFHRLYLGNIHFNVRESEIRELFESYGEVELVVLQKDDNGRSRGHGYVQFKDPQHAKVSLNMNGFKLAERQLRIGLGSDKFQAESTETLKRNFERHYASHMSNLARVGGSGSSSGGGGGGGGGGSASGPRASNPRGGTGLDRIAYRDNGRNDPGNISALDDADVALGTNMNREALMNKLARRDDKNSAGGQTLTQYITQPVQAPRNAEQPSRCIKLSNAFNPADENPATDWAKDIAEDIRGEVEKKIGKVLHIHVDQNSLNGEVHLKLESADRGTAMSQSFNGRFYNGNKLAVSFVLERVYETIFG